MIVGPGVGADISADVGGTLSAGDGSGVGAAVGSAVGAAVGSAVGAVVGSAVGSAVGAVVGSAVGAAVGSAVGAVIGSAVGSVVGSAVGAAVGGTLGPGVGGTVGPGVGAAVGGTLGSGVGAAVGTGEGAGEGANVPTEMLSALAPAMPLLASSRRSSFAVAGSSFSPRIVAFAASARYARRRADESATIDAVKFPLETCHPPNSSRTHAFRVKQLMKCNAAARTGGVGGGARLPPNRGRGDRRRACMMSVTKHMIEQSSVS